MGPHALRQFLWVGSPVAPVSIRKASWFSGSTFVPKLHSPHRNYPTPILTRKLGDVCPQCAHVSHLGFGVEDSTNLLPLAFPCRVCSSRLPGLPHRGAHGVPAFGRVSLVRLQQF